MEPSSSICAFFCDMSHHLFPTLPMVTKITAFLRKAHRFNDLSDSHLWKMYCISLAEDMRRVVSVARFSLWPTKICCSDLGCVYALRPSALRRAQFYREAKNILVFCFNTSIYIHNWVNSSGAEAWVSGRLQCVLNIIFLRLLTLTNL